MRYDKYPDWQKASCCALAPTFLCQSLFNFCSWCGSVELVQRGVNA